MFQNLKNFRFSQYGSLPCTGTETDTSANRTGQGIQKEIHAFMVKLTLTYNVNTFPYGDEKPA